MFDNNSYLIYNLIKEFNGKVIRFMNILIKNATIIPADGKTSFLEKQHIVIEGNTITSVTGDVPDGKYEIIDAKDGIVMPGLVNAHTHSPMSLLRGYADGLPLEKWLNDYIFPKEALLTSQDIVPSVLVSIMEMISSGTTLFADMYDFAEEIADAVEMSGIKALISRGTTYFDPSVSFSEHQGAIEAKNLLKRHGSANGRIKVGFAPHAVYTTTPEFIKYYSDLAYENNTILHIHLSETIKENEECKNKYGKTPVELLESIEAFKAKTLAAHCVHLTENDMQILSDRNVCVAHNPTSNLKLGSGIADTKKMLEKGIDISLGTDGASSNNSLNMLKELQLAALVPCGKSINPTAVSAQNVIDWATNASALGFNDTGEIAPGKKADIAIFSKDAPNMTPCHNPVSAICYSANSSNLDYLLCDGKMIYKKGEFITIDKEKVFFEFNKSIKRIFN